MALQRRVGALLLLLAASRGVSAGKLIEITTRNFDAETSKENLLLVFYAPWCGHCKRLESTWERVAQEFRAEGSPVIMARVDAHNNAALKSRFKIKSLPTLLLFANRRVYSYKGVRGAAELREWALTGHKHATGYDVPPEPNALVVLATRLDPLLAHIHLHFLPSRLLSLQVSPPLRAGGHAHARARASSF